MAFVTKNTPSFGKAVTMKRAAKEELDTLGLFQRTFLLHIFLWFLRGSQWTFGVQSKGLW